MWMTILLLLLLGLIFMLFELFVPGGILGILGVVLMSYAVWASFVHYGAVHGFGVLIFCATSTVVIAVIAVKYLPHTFVGKMLILADDQQKQSGYHAGAYEPKKLMGLEGIAESALRPAGIALIGDERLDVVTEGEFIEPQRRIRVIRVDGNRVVVTQI